MLTDAHTHILYDIDDGAKDISESVKLIEAEIANGVGVVILTPHFDPYKDSLELFARKRGERYEILSRYINENNKNIILIPGSETVYSPALMYYGTLKPLCIGNTRCLLLEFDSGMKFDKEFFTELQKLTQKFDIIPDIAHTERYEHIKKHIKIIEKLKKAGCVIQINAGHIIRNIESKFVKDLFARNYADIIASDCHDSRKRRPNLKEAILLINEKYDGYYDKRLLNKYKFIREK